MQKSKDITSIINIVKEAVKGYYIIVYRDTASYKVEKFIKKEFVNLLKQYDWIVESEGDLTRFLLTDSNDNTCTDSDLIKTYNAYKVNGVIKIARISLVCDWGLYELAFEEKTAKEVLKMIQEEKN